MIDGKLPQHLLQEIGFLLTRVRAEVVSAVNVELADLDLRVREYSVLAIAADTDGVTQRMLSTLLQLDPSRLVALIDGLEQRGLLERNTHPTDRRTNVVQVTAEGYALREQGREAIARGEATALAELTDEERLFLRGLLRRLSIHAQPELGLLEAADDSQA
jgi:DNA-binding MarR family transcriptional regulator